MERLDEWCSTGKIEYDTSELRPAAAQKPNATAVGVLDAIRRKRVLALMLGDTSMGMINGYFGPRLLYPIGFSEHKVDQAWLVEPRASRFRLAGRRCVSVCGRPGGQVSLVREPMPRILAPRQLASSSDVTSRFST